MSARKTLTRIASDELASTEVLSVKVRPLTFGSRKGKNSYANNSQLELIVEAGSYKLDVVDAQIEKFKDRLRSDFSGFVRIMSYQTQSSRKKKNS